MKVLIASLLLVCSIHAVKSYDACSDCPEGYTYLVDTDSCYKYHSEVSASNYAAAETTCAGVSGGSPAMPKTKAEYDAVVEGMGVDKEFWIGLTDIATEGVFVWADGDSLSWSNWNTGEPNDDWGKEDCVYIKVNGLWNDNPCIETKKIVCQAPKRACPAGYSYLEESCSCYKYYPDGQPNYAAAESKCAEVSEGTPVMPQSKAEYDAIVEGLGVDKEFWIGLTDIATEGVYVWANGDSLSWTNWNTGEPNDDWGKEDCVYIKVNGLWNDNPCTESKNILCQAPRS